MALPARGPLAALRDARDAAHQADDAPAYGWIGGIDARADGLHAVPRLVSPALAEAVREGAYRKVSASFYPPGHANHPGGEVWYLRHVGFLGAAPPVVKGLQPVQLGETGDGVLSLELTLSEPPMPDPHPKLAEERAALERDRAALDQARAELDRARAAHARQDAADFAERLVGEGRVLPRDRDALAALLVAAPATATATFDATIEYAEKDGAPPEARPAGAWLRRWLARLPVQVDYAERSRPDAGASAGRTPAIAVPDGWSVAPEPNALHDRVVQFAEKHGVSYDEALGRVAGA